MFKQDGFSLIEALISLFLLSCIMLNFEAMQVYSLRKLQAAYSFHIAGEQVMQMSERLRALSGHTAIETEVASWNLQTQRVLPKGVGSVENHGTFYTISVRWGNVRDRCTKTRTGESGCIIKNVPI